ncbi:multiple epidermal growth factor-like domains protein 11 [Dreissena polymorpha]|uniref:multiple epidermal growth factor-like domains protein 11 n=1 Tax=Dreissena polymorpha TaxID=45954 RepID=UPI002264B6B0|nr:multiple epidermal growth factor-like domains protein 11 [Dreissena polymorpha]
MVTFYMEYRGLLVLALCVVWIFNASGSSCVVDNDGFHRFGPGCSLRCHCRENEPCNNDGSCNGACAPGMFGPGCQYVDIAHEHPRMAKHSSHPNNVYKYASEAVDDYAYTCSTTGNETGYQWWRRSFPYNVTFTYIEFHVQADHADVNECADVDNCLYGTCINEVGGYRCQCPPNYQLNATGTGCVDIDECRETPGICKNGHCLNTFGSYKCICPDGYGLNLDTQECVDVDECRASRNPCYDNAICNNTLGSYRCMCIPGYQLATKGGRCIDINECQDVAGICTNGDCSNSEGSYQCTCNQGYRLAASRDSCLDIDECRETPGICKNGHCQNTFGSYKCICPDGYRLHLDTQECVDVDECRASRNPCYDNAICNNTLGSYRCMCIPGYQLATKGGRCIDINECQDVAGICTNGDCSNREGSYQCTCNQGYRLAASRDSCLDIDECRETPGICKNGHCQNTFGSYKCICPDGYRLHLDTQECVDVDECRASRNPFYDNAICNNTLGSYRCMCIPGYQLATKGGRCIDINECQDVAGICTNGDCSNLEGSYQCTCNQGYRLAASRDSCLVCQPPHFGLNCSQTCSRNCNSTCHHVTGHCSCQPGYQLPDCNEACSKGSWGEGCNHQCGRCQGSQQCDTRTGECPGACEPGYHERLCDKLTESSQFPVELVSGVSTWMLILLVALIVIVVLLMRIRKGKRTQKQNEASNVLSTVREPMSSVHDEPQQLAAAKPNTVSAQKCSPPTSAESVTTMFIQEPVYSNMQDLPPVESSGTIIALSQLQGYVMSKSADEPFFYLEFKKIPYGLQHPATAATAPVTAGKNRYKDMLAYDHSRVVLNIVDGKEGSDYINACFIEGFFKKRAYIASQCPTEAMMDDFWRMIWQYDVSTVVMVTNLVEMGKMKCLRYCPLEVGSLEDFQALTTTLIFMEEFTDYTVRKIKLSHKDKPSVSRVVTHFHYTAWPDKDVPASTSSLLHFWRRIRVHDTDKKQPWVVHCSAGVGRTGTFIAMDILIDEGQARQTVDIYACVTKLRQQRVNMVQTASQYKYLHRLMVEYLSLRSHFVSNNELANYQNTLLQVDQKLNKTGLFLQHETESSYHTLELAEANLKGDEEDPYSSYKVDNKCILTQKPLSDTVVDCWRLIEARDIGLVVTFPDEGNEQDGRMFFYYGVTHCGPF